MANKNFDFYVRFVDPDEAARTTPAKREERIAGPYPATTVQRALTKFYGEYAPKDERADPAVNVLGFKWAKKDIIVLDVMRAKNQVGPQMVVDDEED